ncbi:exo-alpha-sialidase [Reyranella sp.]|uniref:exo-alpha-sialidase n=1 Tax=Reyranella sp. TaxID=1929291 RepID=UPI003BA9C3B5
MRLAIASVAFVLLGGVAVAQHQHQSAHGTPAKAPEPFTAAPAFAPDGTLWLVRPSAGRIMAMKSTDLGRTFSAPVAVTPRPLDLDWGPDARARIAIDPSGNPIVTFAIFQDRNFNGRAFFSRSPDGGASFPAPRPITADATSQRFETAAVDPSGRVFATWLDKRDAARARAAGKPYPGAALAYAWEDGAGGFGPTTIALDNTCECCRLSVAFAGAGRPAVVFRNIFPGSVRDHAVLTFKDAATPGPLRRVSVDGWKIEACPHHGPSIAIAPDGSQHVAWFTDGAARQGLFYARADSADAPFDPPRALSVPERQPARPFLLANGPALHLVWKEFNGERTAVRWQASRDSGRTWSAPRTVADTGDASDHPLLVAHAGRAYLSWLTEQEGYRLIPLEEQP